VAKRTLFGDVGTVRSLSPYSNELLVAIHLLRTVANVTQREHSTNVMAPPKAYPQSDTPKAQNIIELDCRGLEFVEFKPDGEWLATGAESGTKFTAIDLSEGEWFDYDEKAGEEVSIREVKWEIRRA